MKFLNICLLLLFISSKTLSQTKNWQEITTADGLSHAYVYQILQTKDGYIWISTNEGLNRYDGYNFTVYLPEPNNPNSISDIRIKAIHEDKKGRLWITTQSRGLNVFDRIHNKFYHCQLADKSQPKDENITGYKIVEDADGNIWIGSGMSTIFKVIIPESWKNGYPKGVDFSNEIQILPIKLTDTKKDEKQIFLDKDTLWIGESSGRIFKLNIKNLQKTEIILPVKGIKQTNREITGFFKDSYGKIWVSRTNEGIDSFFEGKIEHFDYGFSSNLPYYYWLDGQGKVWLKESTSAKVWRIDCHDLKSINLNTLEPIFYSKSKSYKSFISTKENTLFVGDVRGLKKIDNREKIFNHILSETDISDVFMSRKGEIFVSTGGITSIYKENQLPKPAFRELNRAKILQTKNGDIWAVGEANTDEKITFFRYSEELKLKGLFPLKNYGNNESPSILEDSEGNIWLAASDGNLLKFDTKTNLQLSFSYKNIIPPTSDLHSGESFSIFQSINNKIWIATEDGLIEVDNVYLKPTFKRHLSNSKEPGGLRGGVLQAVIDDPNQAQNYLWIGTKQQGLVRMEKKTGKCIYFTKNEGLPNNTIWGILKDDKNYFWINTNKGIFRFNPKSFEINIFTRSDGLQSEIFNKKAYSKSLNGEVLFAGNNGVNVFDPNKIVKIDSEPNIKITEIEVNNKKVLAGDESEILSKEIEFSNEIDLKYSQNTIKIFFSVLDFADSKNNIFRYQLEGLDKGLVEAGTEHTATYVALPIGTYTFKVYGSSRGGSWNKKPISLKITILPPFYRTWWAYLLYLSILTYIVYRFYQNQINRIKLSQELIFNQKEAQRLAELDQLKTNFFTNISHEFRTPLTLILSPIEDLIRENPSKNIYQIIHRNANRLLQLINQLLDLSKLEAKQMQIELEEVELNSYFRRLASSFSSLAESKNITFEVNISMHNLVGKIDKDKIEKIINNLLSNAFKFTEKGKKVSIEISYFIDNQALIIKIKDEGVGISKENLAKIFDRFYQVDDGSSHEKPNRKFEGTGIGLALVKELVDVLKGKINVESKEGFGTTFLLEIALVISQKNIFEQAIGYLQPTSSNEEKFVSSEKNGISKPENILLIVDDNEDIRTYISSIFKETYQIIEAVNGKDGILKATENIPNLIISDLMMPEMDGFEFCKMLKSDEKTSHIPVIMLTAKANIESRIEGLELGADDYLLKPFNATEIQIRVKNLVKKQERLRSYFQGNTIELKPNEIKVSSKEAIFLQKVKNIIETHLSENNFSVVEFAEEMNMSQTQLLRKLKALTNQTINEFIRDFRLQRAADLLSKKTATVSEIAYQVGFESLSYFTKTFQEKFGKLPSEYK